MNLSLAGLALGVYRPEAEGAEAHAEPPEGVTPNVFLHVGTDGWVSVWCARSEMGQGVRSSLPVLIADELGADLARVRVVQADGDAKYGDQNTDGSSSVRDFYDELRRAGAAGRMMLVGAAAKRWRVAPGSCTAANGRVTHRGTGRSLDFGKLAALAAKEPLPKAAEVTLRPDSELTHVGTVLPLVDAQAYVTGAARYAADILLPGMLTAVIARPPVVGGRATRYDATAALAVPGVKQLIEMPTPRAPWHFQPWGGLAVVAENTWAALKGRAALEVQWDAGANGGYDSEAFRKTLSAHVNAPGKIARKVGDVDAALKTAARVVEAEYHVPHLAHAPMEPPCATVRIENGACEVWACTQDPQTARTEVAKTLGLPESKVTVHVTFLGGGFGRKSKADFINEAAFLAQATGKPLRVQWTREDDLQHDFYNAVSTQKLSAGLDASGKVTAWRHRTAFTPIGSLFTGADQPGVDDLQQGVQDLALSIPNVSAEIGEARAFVRVGWLRSVYNIFHGFAIGSFMDELAVARGMDPRESWLELLGPPRLASLEELGVSKLKNYGASLEKHPVDVARLRRVIERVTASARWSERKREGRVLGLAAHRSFLSYTAVVVSVVKRPRGKIAVDEAWIALDAGRIINLDRVRSQLEGAVLFGMSHAFYGGATMKAGATEQTNFHDHRLVRMTEAPRKIHVDVVESTEAPGGVGEPGVPPVAPAIANALFALTGTRLRDLPFGKSLGV